MTRVAINMSLEVDAEEWAHLYGSCSVQEIRKAIKFQIDQLVREKYSNDLVLILKSCRQT